jgi:formate hydrogenlyase transcriptional activator
VNTLELRQVIDRIPVLAWCNLPEGPNEFLNKRWHDYTGLSPEQSHGWGWHAAFHPEDLPSLMEKWRQPLITAQPGETEARLRRFDGVYRWFLINVEPLRDTAGRIVRWYGTSTDIDDRKHAEARLRRENAELKKAEERIGGQEAELRQILDFTPQMIAVNGPRRERLYANCGALAYLGTTLEQWQHHTIESELHPDDVERVHLAASSRQAVASAVELEVRIRKYDGTYRWFLARYIPLCDEAGNQVRWYIACTDIEDRKRAQERLQQENLALREEIDKTLMFEEIVGTSPALKSVLSRISKVARTDATVLISGETGTGKELVARAIHRRSRRAAGAFVAVNCASIAHEQMASELFGHEAAVFPGAAQRMGRFELAHGGSIFFDEVGELPPEMQAALLRVLQERELRRAGGSESLLVDVRVIAATNRDLQDSASGRVFRRDLFYRLNVFPLQLPALRERAQDIPLLVEYFVQRYARTAGKKFRRVNRRTLQHLQSYPWPGNVRELQNVIERSVIVCDDDEFTVDESWISTGTVVKAPGALPVTLAMHEKEIIEEALRASGGRVYGPAGAAARLGMPRSTLESRILVLQIDKNRFRPTRSR